MPVVPPKGLFRLDVVDVFRVENLIDQQPKIIEKIVEVEVIKEVEKIIYKDDPALLMQLNQALKENGELKMKMISTITNQELPEVKIETIETIKEVRVWNRNIVIIASISSLIVGMLSMYIILK